MRSNFKLAVFYMLVLCGLSATTLAKPTQNYFPANTNFDKQTPLPEALLGHEIGDWHVSPANLTAYMRRLANQNARVHTETIGYSHERNALVHVIISSADNIANLDALLKKHQNATSAKNDILVLNLSYSVHGNEPSGANASPLLAYYLAASKEDWVKDFLAKTIVIIEPVQNPDGLGRHAAFVNQHKGATENFGGANRDHYEAWPSARTNHYWFDLNRDWIFAVHPESQARIKSYQKWQPHVLGDYHEMGGDFPTYFFQPGHPKRTHPLTSKDNQRLTMGLAKFHAQALDARKQPYFSGERYDDFYYSKGSAYPDAAGGIGLLFEQTGVRGHARNIGGVKFRFQDAVANQLATSLSLLKGADALRGDLLTYRFSAQKRAAQASVADPIKAYVFSDDGDPKRAAQLLDILNLHQIPVFDLTANMNIKGEKFTKDHAWVVKTNGPQYSLIRSLFETRTVFEDTVFYDISTWNLPLALNLPYAPLQSFGSVSAKSITSFYQMQERRWAETLPAGYAIDWNQYRAPHLLQALLKSGLSPRMSSLGFTTQTTTDKTHIFKAGTIVVRPQSKKQHAKIREILSVHPSIKVHELPSGLSPLGPDFGSRAMRVLKPVKPALLVGKGVRPTGAGAIRYTVDSVFGAPLTLLDLGRLGSTDLTDYTHILLAGGSYKSWDKAPEVLKNWVKDGGIIIAQKEAATWLEKKVIFKDKDKKSTKPKSKQAAPIRRAYQDYEQDQGKRRVSGAVLRTIADLTHPLLFGFSREQIPVFYNAKASLKEAPISYDNPLVYAKKNLLITGYADSARLKEIQNTPAITLHRLGKGKIVLLNHEANFRAFWAGTQRLYANALFFTQTIETRKDPKPLEE